nr:fusion protein [Hyphantria cunea nucleopolyhedrovirus]UIX56402.1 fusion protein [Hyphantria cunea nucleopolyhedrovirus]
MCFGILLLGCSNAAASINYEPVDDATGLLFERISAVRHVTDQRFVFVFTIDYQPLLEELTKIYEFVRDNEAGDCTLLKAIKPSKPMAILNRVTKQLASLTQINRNFVSYTLNKAHLKTNEVYEEPLDFIDYEDTRPPQNIVDADAKNKPPHWSLLSAGDVRALLTADPRDRVKLLPAMSTSNVTTKYLEYEACMDDSRSVKNKCLYLADMHTAMNLKLADAAGFANTLDRLIKQTYRNKLNNINFVLDDNTLLNEMRQLVSKLDKQNLSWVVNFERKANALFDLSQAYKLHLYASKNTIILCVAMPLVDTTALQYSLYKVATVPFCRGTMCLMMVPANKYIAVTDTRNYYTQVPDDFRLQCWQFLGYDEFLCPTSPRIATVDSGVCEIEMFMGRYANDIDVLCDVRVANNNAKQVLLNTLVDKRKWIYQFSSNAELVYTCNEHGYTYATIIVPAGVGVLTASPSLTCSVNVNKGALMFNVNTRFYATPSISYWPQRRFTYNSYVNASLLSQTSRQFADSVTNLSVQQLKTLRSRFHIQDYTQAPEIYFSPRVKEPETKPAHTNGNTVVLVSVLVAVGVFSALCVVGAYCLLKRHCVRRRNSVVVSFNNDDRQPMVAISNSARADVHINVPPNNNNLPKYEKAFLFPMEIKSINSTNNKFV